MSRWWLLTIPLIVAVAIAAYLNALGGAFVLDDRAFLLDNPKLEGAHSLVYFFTENVWHYSNLPDVYSASYRPLYFLTLWLCEHLGIAEPFSLHVFASLLHALACILLLLVIRRLIPDISVSAAGIAVILFAVHPVHVEAVAWISAFVHPLATVFLLAAYLAHDRYRQKAGVLALAAGLLLFGLGLLTNEMAVAFPMFLLLSDRLRFGRFHFSSNLPYLVMLAAYLVLRRAVLGETVPLTFSEPDMWYRFPAFVLEYLRHLVLPWPQPLYLQMPDDFDISAGAWVTALAIALIVAWLRRLPAEARRLPLIGFFWIAIFLLPPLVAAFSPDARFALRSLYLPSAGLSMILAWALCEFPLRGRPIVRALAVSILLLAAVGTAAANRDWVDDGEVYGKIIEFNPEHYAGYVGRGQFRERSGEIDQALVDYQRSVELAQPGETTEPLELLATLLGKSGDSVRSLELFRELALLRPDSALAWNGVGNNLWALGRMTEAANAYLRANAVDPDDRVTCYNLVQVLNLVGRGDEASRYVACAEGE